MCSTLPFSRHQCYKHHAPGLRHFAQVPRLGRLLHLQQVSRALRCYIAWYCMCYDKCHEEWLHVSSGAPPLASSCGGTLLLLQRDASSRERMLGTCAQTRLCGCVTPLAAVDRRLVERARPGGEIKAVLPQIPLGLSRPHTLNFLTCLSARELSCRQTVNAADAV